MPLTAGTRIGPYEIHDAIGAGGMGEVYRARDTRLERQVAIKVLPDAVAQDQERLARFEREARTLAALNHPNIAIIHGLEEANGIRALVMELVEGPTLADRIADAAGPIPVDEAIAIATQIAEALEAAHEQGIIHRDLKPANIKLRPDDAVKVLDFGLAKALEPVGASGASGAGALGLSQSPTITSPALLTGAGVILGTAAYMSPEQAKGRPADKRSDVWAFGCVLYEMLTGARPFDGEDMTDVLGAVVRLEPDWSRLPAGLSPPVRALVQGCLVKDRRRRIADISTALFVLRNQKSLAAGASSHGPTATVSAGRMAWVAAAVLLMTTLGLSVPAMRHLREPPAVEAPETRAEIVTPATDDPLSFALSPDGTQLVFAASDDRGSRLWLRSLATTEARALDGTDGAAYPFWSPDGRSVAFFAGGALKRLDLAGGAPRTIATTATSRGGAWNADGVILFEQSVTGPLFRVPAAGGEPAQATTLDRQVGHRFPQFLSDGRRFLFYALGAADTGGIFLGSLDSPVVTRVTPSESAGAYLPPGRLFWARDGVLVTQQFAEETGILQGEPAVVADGVGVDVATGALGASVSSRGTIAYRTGSEGERQLAWFDRSGRMLESFGSPDGTQLQARLSPDGRRVALGRRARGNIDIWILDGARASRLTTDPEADRFPTWSPDGHRIAFSSTRTGQANVFVKAADGSGSEEPLVPVPQNQYVQAWSADGRFIFYMTDDPKTGFDLWILPLEGERKPSPLLVTPFNERGAAISPDGRWFAYASDESGRYEVHARALTLPRASGASDTASGGQWQISTGGGTWPRWSRDGRELYYVGPDGSLMAAPIAASDTAITPGIPVPLFRVRMVGGGDLNLGPQYDLGSDGRFLINTVAESATAPITLLQNWKPPAPGDAR